ncbi:MAG: helix-hairpin-helix domain-containing protein [Bacteroidetes bacterium]|nr:helix-hairpin-helix domain-containing protein [Bacteroidota bacterium]
MRRRSTRPWKEELKDLFVLHRSERQGFTWLVVLCLLAAGWATYEQWVRPDVLPDGPALEVAWQAMRAEEERGRAERAPRADVRLFAFDPNGLATSEWVKLGLSERQAEAVHRFEEHGGRFRTKRDLARMRVVDPALFAQWEPYIQLPDSLPKEGRIPYAERSGSQWDKEGQRKDRSDRAEGYGRLALVEINTADTVRLVQLPGIGPAFARGIVKYRERLGGFLDLDQLDEVYVLRDKPEARERLKRLFVLDTSAVRRHALNRFTADELGPHPYAGWKVAKALVAYRQQHGPFARVADIKGCALVTDSVYRRLAPYLEAD